MNRPQRHLTLVPVASKARSSAVQSALGILCGLVAATGLMLFVKRLVGLIDDPSILDLSLMWVGAWATYVFMRLGFALLTAQEQ